MPKIDLICESTSVERIDIQPMLLSHGTGVTGDFQHGHSGKEWMEEVACHRAEMTYSPLECIDDNVASK